MSNVPRFPDLSQLDAHPSFAARWQLARRQEEKFRAAYDVVDRLVHWLPLWLGGAWYQAQNERLFGPLPRPFAVPTPQDDRLSFEDLLALHDALEQRRDHILHVEFRRDMYRPAWIEYVFNTLDKLLARVAAGEEPGPTVGDFRSVVAGIETAADSNRLSEKGRNSSYDCCYRFVMEIAWREMRRYRRAPLQPLNSRSPTNEAAIAEFHNWLVSAEVDKFIQPKFDKADEYESTPDAWLKVFGPPAYPGIEQSVAPLQPGRGRFSRPGPAGKPVWDASAGRLTFRGCEKLVARKAPGLRKLLDVFQEEDWPERVHDPFPPHVAGERSKASRVVESANQSVPFLRFRMDGTGGGIRWSPADD